jgi:sodium-dependent dicarboxylate transporter 2/3/5
MNTITKNYLSIAIALFISIGLYLINPLSLGAPAAKVLAIAALIITLWVTDAMPMPVVALLPIVLFPLMKIATIEASAAP